MTYRDEPQGYDYVEASRQILAHQIDKAKRFIERTEALSRELPKLGNEAAKAFYYRLISEKPAL